MYILIDSDNDMHTVNMTFGGTSGVYYPVLYDPVVSWWFFFYRYRKSLESTASPDKVWKQSLNFTIIYAECKLLVHSTG